MSSKIKANDFKRKKKTKTKKKQKTKQELEEERKQREAVRAKRDQDRAKKRLQLRARILENKNAKKIKAQQNPLSPHTTQIKSQREQRRKILGFRRAQSRFALPKITQDDNMDDIAKANAELNAEIEQNEKEKDIGYPDTENINNKDKKEDDKNSKDVDDEKKNDDNNNDNNDNDDDNDDDDTASVISHQSVQELTLATEQEAALDALQSDLEKADPDFFGFVDWKLFLTILKKNDIELSVKHETYLMAALKVIDEGVDYYDFIRQIREVALELQPDNTLQDICEEISETQEKRSKKAEKEKKQKEQPKMTEKNVNTSIDEHQDEFEAFYAKAVQNRGRGMSLANMTETSSNVNKESELKELIDDLGLDGAEVDFALLKMALSTIDCNPPDKDLKLIINHLDEEQTGFIDFNYFLTFLQDTSNIPAKRWRNVEKIIAKVVKQLRMIQRAEERKQKQAQKAKERLDRIKQKGKGKNVYSTKEELAKMEKEKKRMDAIARKKKAQQQYK